ncbi:MAG: hypothetical protein IPO67_22540 [Deltaproteobacteria bacterium]|nr:hypothetical protein [Deltaproteobacteria bacterium]
MRTLRLMMCLLGLALVSGEVFAADWTKTLPQNAVQGYVVGQGQRIVVVAAGGEAVDREAATASLITALRGGPAVSLVMDDASLGDVSALDDAAIVQKAKNLPVDQVHVVRVFPAGGGVMSVVVTMYDKQGAVLGGFNADTAAPLKAAGGGAQSGVSAVTAAAVSTTNLKTGSELEASMNEFKEKFIWVEEVKVAWSTGQVTTQNNLKRGEYGESLTLAQFYNTIGRQDLAKNLAQENALKMKGGGAAAAGAGVFLLAGGAQILHAVPCNGGGGAFGDDRQSCVQNRTAVAMGSTVALSAVGTLFMVKFGRLFAEADQIGTPTHAEVRKLADEYNEQLQQELGIPDSAFQPQSYSLTVTPTAWAAPGNVGIGLSGEF